MKYIITVLYNGQMATINLDNNQVLYQPRPVTLVGWAGAYNAKAQKKLDKINAQILKRQTNQQL